MTLHGVHRERGRLVRGATFVAFGLALALIVTGCLPDDTSVRRTQVRQATFDLDGVPALSALSANGAITVQGVEGQTTVAVTATLHARGATEAQADARLEQIVLSLEQDGNRVTLAYRTSDQTADVRRYCGVDFLVALPVRADVELRTSNGAIAGKDLVGTLTAQTSNGAIEVTNVQGDLRLDTSNGAVRARGVEGAIDIETSNGAIQYQGRPVGATHTLRTSNGRIDVTLPGDIALLVSAHTSNGTISTNLPLTGDTQGTDWSALLNPPSAAVLNLSTSNGSIWIGGAS